MPVTCKCIPAESSDYPGLPPLPVCIEQRPDEMSCACPDRFTKDDIMVTGAAETKGTNFFAQLWGWTQRLVERKKALQPMAGLQAFAEEVCKSDALERNAKKFGEMPQGKGPIPPPDKEILEKIYSEWSGIWEADRSTWPEIANDCYDSLVISVGLKSFGNSLSVCLRNLALNINDDKIKLAMYRAIDVASQYEPFKTQLQEYSSNLDDDQISNEVAAAALGLIKDPWPLLPILVARPAGRMASGLGKMFGTELGLTDEAIIIWSTIFNSAGQAAAFTVTNAAIESVRGNESDWSFTKFAGAFVTTSGMNMVRSSNFPAKVAWRVLIEFLKEKIGLAEPQQPTLWDRMLVATVKQLLAELANRYL